MKYGVAALAWFVFSFQVQEPPPKPQGTWVVVFRIVDEESRRRNEQRHIVQGVEPIIELRVLTLGESEGDAVAKAILISQRYVMQADWEKVKFVEAQEKKEKQK